MKINIDTEEIEVLPNGTEEIVLSNDAEKNLVALLQLQKSVEDALDEAKRRIEEKALQVNPNFKSVVSDNLRISYREYGGRYRIDETNVEKLPRELYLVKYSPKAPEIESYIDEHGVPLGIDVVERKKTLTISLKRRN